MIVECIKTSAGLIPYNDMEADKFKRFKNGELYSIDIKEQRNHGQLQHSRERNMRISHVVRGVANHRCDAPRHRSESSSDS